MVSFFCAHRHEHRLDFNNSTSHYAANLLALHLLREDIVPEWVCAGNSKQSDRRGNWELPEDPPMMGSILVGI